MPVSPWPAGLHLDLSLDLCVMNEEVGKEGNCFLRQVLHGCSRLIVEVAVGAVVVVVEGVVVIVVVVALSVLVLHELSLHTPHLHPTVQLIFQ